MMDIELADAVAVVREELLEAAQRGVGQQVGFVVGPIEMEFTVELKADAKAKAGFKAWVLASAEVEAGVSRGRTHTVRVTLTPKNATGGDLLISDTTTDGTGPGDVSGHLGR
jgi:Trypsin-co-occurring domain 2